MLKLKEYELIAKKILAKRNLDYLIKNPDAIDNIISSMASGDWKYKKNKSKEGYYRSKCANWGIAKFFQQQEKEINLKNKLFKNYSSLSVLNKSVQNTKNKELIEEMLEESNLKEFDKNVVRWKTFHRMTLREISEKTGKTVQWIQIVYSRSIQSLKYHAKSRKN